MFRALDNRDADQMRGIVIVLVSAALCATAHAECGPNGSADVLAVSDWSVDVGPDQMGMITAKTTVEIQNKTDRAIRMVDGSVLFTDALGGYITNIGIERDLTIAAGDTASWSAEYGGTGLERIPDLRRDEVTVEACVSAVLYDDGSKQQF